MAVTHFIAPMLCERLTNLSRLTDRTYIAEPKLDGQRAQLYVHERRAVACYSRRGLDLLEHPGWHGSATSSGHSSRPSSMGKLVRGMGMRVSRPSSPRGNVSAGTWLLCSSVCSTWAARASSGNHGAIGGSAWRIC